LAHMHLSGESEELLVGNFIGDFVKGKEFKNYTRKITEGILLHRAIDEYTDNHEVVSESKDKLRKKYRHYAGVIVDMFYDHFLALNWTKFHHLPLQDFSQHCYTIIEKYLKKLPRGVQYMFPYMQANDWLYNYSKVEGLQRALNGMSRRTTFDSKMESATVELKKHYDEFNSQFLSFYPDLISFSNDWIESNTID
ncbi:DUF479 domain-containing protein, partial [Fulvivirga sp. RKSG066]|uniref:acyl carrier protein phosphodiesterase n=1 Tax=Fulvivirga aurantia TaxID=2529383 RepID=UPI0012BC2ED7